MATKVSPLTLVDLTLEPKQTYMVLDLLYETAGLYPANDTQELIEYLEDRLYDLDLPLTIEEYEGRKLSPEFEKQKRIALDFFANPTDDSTTVEPDESLDCD